MNTFAHHLEIREDSSVAAPGIPPSRAACVREFQCVIGEAAIGRAPPEAAPRICAKKSSGPGLIPGSRSALLTIIYCGDPLSLHPGTEVCRWRLPERRSAHCPAITDLMSSAQLSTRDRGSTGNMSDG